MIINNLTSSIPKCVSLKAAIESGIKTFKCSLANVQNFVPYKCNFLPILETKNPRSILTNHIYSNKHILFWNLEGMQELIFKMGTCSI